MRLLNTHNLEITEFPDDRIPIYAILSHTWEEEEVTFHDMTGTHPENKKGYKKVEQSCGTPRGHCTVNCYLS
jgi:hypothetical protein